MIAALGRQRALNNCGQATKGAWGMSWRQKTMTGVEDCEKSGVVVKQTLIPARAQTCENRPLALRPIGPGFRRLGGEAAAPGGL
jgi:hypothetical protein